MTRGTRSGRRHAAHAILTVSRVIDSEPRDEALCDTGDMTGLFVIQAKRPVLELRKQESVTRIQSS